MKSRHIGAVIALVVLLPFAASALSADDIQQQIKNLLAQVAQLQEQLRLLQTNSQTIACTMEAKVCPDGTAVGRTGPRCEFAACSGEAQSVPPYRCPDIKRALFRGMSGNDVADIQEALGVERTGFFGAKTEAAVQALQAREGIVSAGSAASTGWGYIGPRTREAFLRRCGGWNQNFSASPTSGAAPLAVSFSARSGPDLLPANYSMDFGDGTSGGMTGVYGTCEAGSGGPCNGGNNMLASHTYQNAGTYVAKLMYQEPFVCNAPPGAACMQVVANPKHVGTVVIRVGTQTDNISFSASPTSGTAPLAVIFRSNIVNGLDSYSISFGDGTSGTWQNNCAFGLGGCGMPTASHTYTSSGTYTAQLIKSNPGGCGAVTNPQCLGAPAYREVIGTVTINVGGGSQAITVTSPNGNESWDVGSQKNVAWNDGRTFIAVNYYDIFLDQYMAPCLYACPAFAPVPFTIATHVTGGSYSWGVGNVTWPTGSKAGAGKYTVRVCDSGSQSSCDSSDQPFTIVDPVYESNKPPSISSFTGPTTLAVGQAGTWTAQASDPEGKALYYSFSWCDITSGASGVCSAQAQQSGVVTPNFFTTSFSSTGTYRVSVNVSDDVGKSAQSSVTVTVTGNTGSPSISLTSPGAGTQVAQGGQLTLSWNTQNMPTDSSVGLWLMKPGGGNAGAIALSQSASGSYTWTVPGNQCDANGVCHFIADHPGVWYTEPGSYTIVPKIYSPKDACFGFCIYTPITYPAVGAAVPITITGAGSSGGGAPSISGLDAPISLAVGQTGTWTVRASVPNQANSQLSYSVTWGDEVYDGIGSPNAQASAARLQTSATFTHTYQRAGTFSPVFTVSNSSGSAQTSASVTVSGLSSGQTITRTVGEQEGSFLIQKINPSSVDGLWYWAYPVPTNQGEPKTLYIGDDIGYACEGVSEKLTNIDYYGQKITFTKVVGDRPLGGCPICLASNTVISTPSGDVNVKDVTIGTVVWSLDKDGKKIKSKVVAAEHTPVPATHRVIHLVLADGRQVWVSAGHPTISGSSVSQLRAGEKYNDSLIQTADAVPYWDTATYDILPDSQTGFYWANGILLGSTLSR